VSDVVKTNRVIVGRRNGFEVCGADESAAIHIMPIVEESCDLEKFI
jgi:hypothetical protein